MSYPVYYVVEGDTLPHLFDSFDGGTGASITMTGLAVTDIEIYKDGGTTQRASDSGYALLDTDGIDFDSITGIHGFSIDLSDNTDAGFYSIGPWYHVVISSVTIDGQTVNFIACAFRIVSATRGMAGTALPAAAADAAGGLPISDAGGLDLDAKIGALTFTVAGDVDVNIQSIGGAALSTSTAQLGVNVVEAAATAWNSGAIKATTLDTATITAAKFAAGAIDAAAIAADAIGASELAADAVAEIADGVWDEVLSAATHNVASSAGRRLRTLQTGGNYESGAVWIDTVNGTAGTTADENGVVTNPVDSIADALTIATALGLSSFSVAPGSSVTFAASFTTKIMLASQATIVGGSQDFAASRFEGGLYSGVFTHGAGSPTVWYECNLGVGASMTVESHVFLNCGIASTIVLNNTDGGVWENCFPTGSSPTLDFNSQAATVSVREYSGNLTVSNMITGATLNIHFADGGSLTLGGSDGTVNVYGVVGSVTDNRTGSPTLNRYDMDTRFDAVDTAIATVDTVVDAILVDTGTDGVVVAAASKTGYSLVSTGLDLVTTWTTAITGNITGNLSGSVGSVTGAVGSVTGNVGGNVTGSVGSVAAGGITAASIATDATEEIRNAITGGAYALSTDANGMVRIVDGTGTGELNTSGGYIAGIAGTINTLDALDTAQDTQHSTTQAAITALNNITAAQAATAVRAELATELARIDQNVSDQKQVYRG